MTRFNSGLVGTERTVSPVTASGVWTVNEQTLLNKASLWPLPEEQVDPYIGYVVLLLKMNGANGSTVFTDSSPYSNTATASGNAQISTAQSNFDGASGVFDGSGDFVRVNPPSSALVNWASSDFTIEYWIRPASFVQTGGNNAPVVVGNMNPSTTFNYWSFGPIANGTVRFFYFNGSAQSLTTTTALSINTWYHLAFVKSGSALTIYINGVPSATGTVAGTPQSSTSTEFCIGQNNNVSFNGYIDELRITKNIARYTSAFLPRATPFPTAISGTVDPYYQSVSLLLHMDGSNGSTAFTDSSFNALTVTANGNAQISTAQSKFGGSSLLLDGTDDFLSLSSNALFDLTGDFTIELFARLNSFTGGPVFIGRWGSTNRCWLLGVSSTQITFVTGNNGVIDQIITRTPSTSLLVNTWHHFAVTRLGSTVRIFLDGTQAGANGTASGNCSGVQTVVVGVNGDGNVNDFNGYIDEVRITKGISRYNTTSFTVPTSAFPSPL